MDNKALFKIGYGLYVLTTCYDNTDNGCIINSVMQLTSSPLQIAITVNKGNYTHDLIMGSCTFNLSILTTEAPMSLFQHFGLQSGRSTKKFDNYQHAQRADNNIYFLSDFTNAYLSGHVVKDIDLGTHTMFIAELTNAQILSDKPSVTYDYYQQNIKSRTTTAKENNKRKWTCRVCGYVYEGDELSDDFICPICKHGKENFSEITN